MNDAKLVNKSKEEEQQELIKAAAPTMFQKLTDTVEWLGREIIYLRTVGYGEASEGMIFKLKELRDDLAETLRKIQGDR